MVLLESDLHVNIIVIYTIKIKISKIILYNYNLSEYKISEIVLCKSNNVSKLLINSLLACFNPCWNLKSPMACRDSANICFVRLITNREVVIFRPQCFFLAVAIRIVGAVFATSNRFGVHIVVRSWDIDATTFAWRCQLTSCDKKLNYLLSATCDSGIINQSKNVLCRVQSSTI